LRLDDEWIRKNVSMVTPGAAKFILERVGLGRLTLSQDVIDLLEGIAGGGSRGGHKPDWAERAAGDKP
jgi:hypothetical protein